jgi:hypothetical protein
MTALTDSIARELGHPACTMDDPLTAALGQMQDAAAAREAGACTEIQESERQRVEREAADAVRLPRWFWRALPVVVLAVAAFGFAEMVWLIR